MERVLVIGSNGMLGQRLISLLKKLPNYKVFAASYEEKSYIEGIPYYKLDITKKGQLNALIKNVLPKKIFNASAYTAVDKAETEHELADAINYQAVKDLADFTNEISAHLVHISTDYVFDGKEGPYSEDHPTNPIGYYGLSKLKGENAILASECSATILRTNVLYGPAHHGRQDFVKWVVDSLKNGKEIKIVTDQINNPTYLDDLALAMIRSAQLQIKDIINIGGEEFLSRYDFTLRIADYFGLDKSLIKPITTEELNQPAKRPLKSGLKIDKAKKLLNYKPTTIEESFNLMNKELNLK